MTTPHISGAAAIFNFWLGLASTSDYATNLIWWNSIRSLTKGCDCYTNNLFVTTSIHNHQKYGEEPFRWAGDYPRRDPQTIDADSASSTDDIGATPSPAPLNDLLMKRTADLIVSLLVHRTRVTLPGS